MAVLQYNSPVHSSSTCTVNTHRNCSSFELRNCTFTRPINGTNQRKSQTLAYKQPYNGCNNSSSSQMSFSGVGKIFAFFYPSDSYDFECIVDWMFVCLLVFYFLFVFCS